MLPITFVLGLLIMMLSADAAQSAPLAEEPAPTGLMCDLLAMPQLTEIRSAQPRFSWIVNSHLPNEVQSGYQIVVRGPGDAIAWDTGRVASDQSTAVAYGGSALQPHQSYGWRVRTWNKQGAASGWSLLQTVRTGALLSGNETGDDRITVARYPIQSTAVPPVKILTVGPGHEFLDFGRAAFGGLSLSITSPDAGRVIVVHLGEVLAGAHSINRAPGGSRRCQRAEVTLQKGTHTYVVPLGEKDGRMMPPEIGPVMPFRYVEIENCPYPIAAQQLAAHYPFDDHAGRFTCSDPKLNAIWELCRYTMKATSFCGVYVDGDRERLPYEADAYINQLGHYAADREYTLARYTHEHLILHPTWPTEWQSHSIMIAWADYMATGDNRSMAAFYEDLKAKTLIALARPDGLVSTAHVTPEILASLHAPRLADIVDWPGSERDGYEMKPVNTVVNAFYYNAMTQMAQIAAALNKTQDASLFHAEAERAKQSINAKLFDPQTGLYVDGEGSHHSSLHANMCAIAFGLVPPERMAAVAAFVASKGMACSVYGAQYLLEALYIARDAAQAHALMVAPGDRSWAHWVDNLHTTMTLEAWDDKYKPNQDWNHAWGAAPANIIPRGLMGVEPLEPGYRRVRIAPQAGGLTQASLDMPTVRGTVHVAFDSSAAQFTVQVNLPANMTAQVVMPRLGGNTIIVDGVTHPGRVSGETLILDALGSGPHTVAVRG